MLTYIYMFRHTHIGKKYFPQPAKPCLFCRGAEELRLGMLRKPCASKAFCQQTQPNPNPPNSPLAWVHVSSRAVECVHKNQLWANWFPLLTEWMGQKSTNMIFPND